MLTIYRLPTRSQRKKESRKINENISIHLSRTMWPKLAIVVSVPKSIFAAINVNYYKFNTGMLSHRCHWVLGIQSLIFVLLSVFQMSHAATSAFCRSIKLQCELYPSREVAICLDPYCGLGFVLWCLCRWDSSFTSLNWLVLFLFFKEKKPYTFLSGSLAVKLNVKTLTLCLSLRPQLRTKV